MSEFFALILFLVFAAKRLLTYLHIFQQEEYDGHRFLHWLWRERAWDHRLSLALIVLGLAQLVLGERFGIDWVFPVMAGLAFIATAVLEADPRKTAKKKLAMTARAKRIYVIAWILLALVAVSPSDVLFWLIPVQLVPVALVVANLILSPFEARVQRRYWTEAHEKLGKLRPTVIGVTGSYGKTSVKHILGHVLETAGPTLITPGSVNTAMGIARIVRERLQAHHRYFVVEMGAYGPGSIRRLCDLAPPDFGIITAIGKAHYERFKSLEAVAAAKFELAEAVQQKGGRTVVAADTLEFPDSRQFAAAHPEAVAIVAEDAGTSFRISAIRQEPDGVAVTMDWNGSRYELQAPLFGLHQGRNVALAFAAACTLGMAPEDVAASLRSVPQIAHRLEVKRQGNGSVLIDDAYNSNPVGFASALGVLDVLRRPGGRRILVTPGMVELGAAHEAEHRSIGRLAADHVDVLLAVAPQRIAPLTEAFRTAAPSAELVPCAAFAEAQAWLDTHLGPSDAVLIENDLPDLYERPLRL
jgi:UDP-N-acetylmuramoyl-tripeptide--D-alanyl-D-alanine ligase